MTGRVRCCVPFCRRTTPAGRFREWICGKHWKAVSLPTRAARRKWDRLGYKAFNAHRDPAPAWARADRAWEKCKAEAIEAAVGL